MKQKLKNIPKNQILIGGLLGVLLLVIAIPVDSGKKDPTDKEEVLRQETDNYEADADDYERKMERRLKEALEIIDGVGEVEVMITLKDSGESVVEKDKTINSQSTQEEENGVKQSTSDTQSQEATVFSQESSSQIPFISKETTPQVEGILVVAEGGGNSVVIKNISDAVLALFPVEIHKIKVVKMNL